MNPNMVFDLETTGSSINIDDEMRQAMKQVMIELAEVQPMPDFLYDIPASAIASLMGIDRHILGAEVDTSEEKSSGPISEINIANIL